MGPGHGAEVEMAKDKKTRAPALDRGWLAPSKADLGLGAGRKLNKRRETEKKREVGAGESPPGPGASGTGH